MTIVYTFYNDFLLVWEDKVIKEVEESDALQLWTCCNLIADGMN